MTAGCYDWDCMCGRPNGHCIMEGSRYGELRIERPMGHLLNSFRKHVEEHPERALYLLDLNGPKMLYIPPGIEVPNGVHEWIKAVHLQARENAAHAVTT